MSLKNVHLLFITVCLALALFVAEWARAEFSRGGGPAALTWMAVAVSSAIGMGAYGWRFQRRCRRLGL